MNRRLQALLTLGSLGLVGCGGPTGVGSFEPPPFPPDLPTQLTTQNGLVLRASGEVVSTNPTTIRVTAVVTNPSATAVAIETLADECAILVLASWQSSPFLRIVQPLDGGGDVVGSVLGDCGRRLDTRVIGAGETIELTPPDDLVLSGVLRSTFVPGRYILSVIFVDTFIYEVVAMDVQVED